MSAAIITITTNLLRTYMIYRFMKLFFLTNEGQGKYRDRMAYILFFVLTAAIHLIFHSPEMTLLTNISCIVLISSCYTGSLFKIIFVSLLVYGTNMVCDFMSMHILTDYVSSGSINESVAYLTVSLFVIFEIFTEWILIKNHGENKNPYWNILMGISGLSLMELIIVAYGLKNRSLLILAGVCILAMELLIFYLNDVLVEAYKNLEERAILEKEVLMYAHQLDVLMQSESKVRSLRHDIMNHLNEIVLLAENENCQEITEYLHTMENYMKNPAEFVCTGNRNMDSLLNYFLGKAKKELIQVDFSVAVPSELNISMFDLNVILGNLFDNAIEAAIHSEEKWMSVTLAYEKGMLSIEMKNSFVHELQKSGDKYQTTKKEEGHGIGLGNVKKMVEQYDGMIEIKPQNDKHIFAMRILLFTKV